MTRPKSLSAAARAGGKPYRNFLRGVLVGLWIAIALRALRVLF